MSDTNSPAPSAPSAQSADSSAPEAPTEAAAGEGGESTPAPKKKPPQYKKYKVGDEELALSDEDIVRHIQKGRGADAKFREAAEARKSVESFMKALQEDPMSVLADKRLPIDRKALAEKWLVDTIQAELNPPDPRDAKLTETERKLKEYQDREAKEKETREQTERQAMLESRKGEISKTLAKAMELTHLSAHPETAAATLRELAVMMRSAKERGIEVTPEELVENLHNSRFQQYYTLANTFAGDELLEFLGDDVVKKIRQADLARLKAGREQGASHKNEEWTSSKSKESGGARLDAHAVKERVRKMMLGK